MQPLDEIILRPCTAKSRYDIIYEFLKDTIDEINVVNVELHSIRNKVMELESKNEILVKKFCDTMTIISNCEIKDSFSQSDTIEVFDKGVNCNKRPKYIDSAVQIEDPFPDVISTEPEKIEKEESVPDIADTSSVIQQPAESGICSKTDTVVIVQQPIETQLYSKADMLFYLQRYKISFLSFVQSNQNDIENISGSCNDLIRSFSNNSDNERRKNKKRPERQLHKSGSQNKPGVIDTKDNRVDEGITRSLYDDLDYQDPLGSLRSRENEIAKIGGEKRLVTMSNMANKSLMKTNAEGAKCKKPAEIWSSEIVDLAEKHEKFYPTSSEPMKETPAKIEEKKPLDTVFSIRMKEQFERQCKPMAILPTVKYDMSVADSPLFDTTLRVVKKIESPPKLMTEQKTEEIVPEVKIAKLSRKNEELKSAEIGREVKTAKLSRNHEEPKRGELIAEEGTEPLSRRHEEQKRGESILEVKTSKPSKTRVEQKREVIIPDTRTVKLSRKPEEQKPGESISEAKTSKPSRNREEQKREEILPDTRTVKLKRKHEDQKPEAKTTKPSRHHDEQKREEIIPEVRTEKLQRNHEEQKSADSMLDTRTVKLSRKHGEQAAVEIISDARTARHGRKHEENKLKRRHSSKKKSQNSDKDLEEGEIA